LFGFFLNRFFKFLLFGKFCWILDGMPANNYDDSAPAEDPAKLAEEKEFEESVEEETEQ
jgi:hypothetical protein